MEKSKSKAAPELLQQLESMMSSREKENEELRRRVLLLEEVLRQHGINSVIPVQKKDSFAESTSDTQSETESLATSLTGGDEDFKIPKKAQSSISALTEDDKSPKSRQTTSSYDFKIPKKAQSAQSCISGLTEDEKSKPETSSHMDDVGSTDILGKVNTVVEEDDDDDDDDDILDDATQKTTRTSTTFHTRRSLIMPPLEHQTKESEPYPQGTQPGGRWYKKAEEGYGKPEPWTKRLTCTCSPGDVDPQDELYVYYDRRGSHKYFTPTGERISNPVHTQGVVLTVVPNDGTMLAYFNKLKLPLYHQKQHVKMRSLKSYNRSSAASTTRSSVRSSASSVRSGLALQTM